MYREQTIDSQQIDALPGLYIRVFVYFHREEHHFYIVVAQISFNAIEPELGE